MVSKSTILIFVIVFAILGLLLGIAESTEQSIFLQGHSVDPIQEEYATSDVFTSDSSEEELNEGPFDLGPGQL